jgi:hypothetical protein
VNNGQTNAGRTMPGVSSFSGANHSEAEELGATIHALLRRLRVVPNSETRDAVVSDLRAVQREFGQALLPPGNPSALPGLAERVRGLVARLDALTLAREELAA